MQEDRLLSPPHPPNTLHNTEISYPLQIQMNNRLGNSILILTTIIADISLLQKKNVVMSTIFVAIVQVLIMLQRIVLLWLANQHS